MKSTVPKILLALCSLMILVDVYVNYQDMDKGFWLRILANSMIILSMVLTLRKDKVS